MPPAPEQQARQIIDRQLDQCGWIVQDRAEMNIYAAPGVAIREFPLTTGSVDYMLYADGKAIGVVEAKPAGHTLTGVEVQSDTRLRSLWRRGKTEAGSDLSFEAYGVAVSAKTLAA